MRSARAEGIFSNRFYTSRNEFTSKRSNPAAVRGVNIHRDFAGCWAKIKVLAKAWHVSHWFGLVLKVTWSRHIYRSRDYITWSIYIYIYDYIILVSTWLIHVTRTCDYVPKNRVFLVTWSENHVTKIVVINKVIINKVIIINNYSFII